MRFEPFQRRFLAAVDNPRYRTVAASWPRGCGKTTLAGHVVARALTPGDPLYVAGGEIVLFAGSIEQCRLTFRQALTFLEPRIGEYRTVDSATRRSHHPEGLPDPSQGGRLESENELGTGRCPAGHH